jgi:hypothetical protein
MGDAPKREARWCSLLRIIPLYIQFISRIGAAGGEKMPRIIDGVSYKNRIQPSHLSLRRRKSDRVDR